MTNPDPAGMARSQRTSERRGAARPDSPEPTLARTLEDCGFGVWDFWPATRTARWSRTTAELLGLAVPADGEGALDALLFHVHPDDRREVDAALSAALSPAGDGRFEVGMRVGLGDGRWRRIEGRGRVIRAEAGVPERITCVCVETRPRREPRPAARNREQLLRRIYDHVPTGIAVTDLEGRFLACNPAYAAMLGRSEAELRRRAFADVVHPDDRADNVACVAELIALRRPGLELENRYVDRNGEAVWVHKFVTLLRDEAGLPSHLVALVTDITARKHAQAALDERDARLAAVLRAARAGTFDLDIAAGGPPSVSPTTLELFGFEPACAPSVDAFVGRVDERDRDRVRAAIASSLRDGVGHAVEYRVARADGSVRWLASRADVQTDPQGRVNRLIGVVLDVTAQHQAEDAAREGERFVRRVLDGLFAFVGVMALDGTLLEANRAPLEAAGIAASDVIGRKFWDCHWWSHSTDEQARLRAACERALAGEVVRYDVQVRMAGDALMWIDFQLAPLRDESGRITHLVPSAMDLTERRAIEDALRASEEFTRRVTDAAPGMVYIYDLAERRNVWGNREVGAVLGYDRAQVDALGARLLDELLHPEDALRYVGHARRLAALADGEAAEFEYRMRRSDDTWLWLSSREMVFARDADGAVRQIVGTAVDISGRKAIEERLAASEERLQLALSAVGAGVFDWDLDGGALVWDARVWALIDADPGVPAHVDRWLERVHPDEIAEVRARIDRVLHDPRSDGVWRLRHRIRRAAGGWRWLDALGRVHFAGEGAARRPVRFVGVLLDASDEVETAERLVASQHALEESVAALREADRRKDEFLATLAHELRNPLAPIVNAVRLLEAGRTGMAPMAARAVDMIARQARQMRHLVDDLLEMSRITRGTVTLKPERVVVGTLVAGAVEAAQPAALAKRQRLEVALPDRPVEIVADPVRVAQVLENLIGNALKYTPQEGSIRVVLGEARDGHVEIVVADDGIGIPAGRLEEIFELFVQAEPGVGEHQGGLGIGLAMVKRLVELHGGTVRAASAGRGRGATFVVRLPVAGPPPG